MRIAKPLLMISLSVFLLAVGSETAGKIMARLPEDMVERMTQMISSIGHVTYEEKRKVLDLVASVTESDDEIALAEDKYLRAVAPGREMVISDTLKDLEERFGDRFVRTHRNALVALGHIERLERWVRERKLPERFSLDEQLVVLRVYGGYAVKGHSLLGDPVLTEEQKATFL